MGAVPTPQRIPSDWRRDPQGTSLLGSVQDTGPIYRADLATGTGSLVTSNTGGQVTDMAFDRRGLLIVGGGAIGDARILNPGNGDVRSCYPLSDRVGLSTVSHSQRTPHGSPTRFTPRCTDYPLPSTGAIPDQNLVQQIPLTGDFVLRPNEFNASAITTTPDGTSLIITQENNGKLFQVDTATGATTTVDLSGTILDSPDGFLRLGNTLYVTERKVNRVASLTLSSSGRRARLRARVSDPRFDIPTRIAEFQDRLYIPNSRTTTPPKPTTRYTAVAIQKF
ncbi:MAG: superoxide dismutase [Pseudonocardiaceae bacterium]